MNELRRLIRRLPTHDSEQRLIVGGSLALAVLLHVSAMLFIASLPEQETLTPVPSGLQPPVRSVAVVMLERVEEREEPRIEPPVERIQIAEPPPRVEPQVELARLDITPPPAPAQPRLQRRPRRVKKATKRPEQSPKPAAAAAPRPAVKQITSNAPGAAEGGAPETQGPPGEGAPSSAPEPVAEMGGSPNGADTGAAVGPQDGAEEGPDLDALAAGYVGRVTRAVKRSYQYPRAARRAGLEGRVLVELIIDAAGHIIATRVVKSSGHPALDKAALKAIASLGDLPAPPRELGWTRKAMTVPFVYRLGRG